MDEAQYKGTELKKRDLMEVQDKLVKVKTMEYQMLQEKQKRGRSNRDEYNMFRQLERKAAVGPTMDEFVVTYADKLNGPGESEKDIEKIIKNDKEQYN